MDLSLAAERRHLKLWWRGGCWTDYYSSFITPDHPLTTLVMYLCTIACTVNSLVLFICMHFSLPFIGLLFICSILWTFYSLDSIFKSVYLIYILQTSNSSILVYFMSHSLCRCFSYFLSYVCLIYQGEFVEDSITWPALHHHQQDWAQQQNTRYFYLIRNVSSRQRFQNSHVGQDTL